MNTYSEVKQTLTNEKPLLSKKFGVKRVGVFGSFVRGEQNNKSDVDILVDFEKPVGFFTFLGLEEYLKEKLKRPVDLVTKKALKPTIGKRILQEMMYI